MVQNKNTSSSTSFAADIPTTTIRTPPSKQKKKTTPTMKEQPQQSQLPTKTTRPSEKKKKTSTSTPAKQNPLTTPRSNSSSNNNKDDKRSTLNSNHRNDDDDDIDEEKNVLSSTTTTTTERNNSNNHDDNNYDKKENGTAAAATAKISTTPSSTKTATKSGVASSSTTSSSKNKTYLQLVEEAINALKEYRTGSSLASIKKYIVSNYPQLDINNNAAFNARLSLAIKTGCTMKPIPRFEKVKVSYRIAPEYKIYLQNQKRRMQRSGSSSNNNNSKNKSSSSHPKQQQKANSKNDTDTATTMNNGSSSNGGNSMNGESNTKQLSEDELKQIEERKQRKLIAIQEKMEADLRAKQIAEKIRRRKFPMEDTKLHMEDKLYNVKPPTNVTSRPYLPYFWHSTIQPYHHPKRTSGKTNSFILNHSKVEDHPISIYDTRGIVPDVLQIYHFFRGDVHCNIFFNTNNTKQNNATNGHIKNNNNENNTSDAMIVPPFTLQQLIYNVEMMLNGTMKRTKCVPPLIVHLFVICLQILTSLPTTPNTEKGEQFIGTTTSKDEKQLRQDLYHYLHPAISPVSWSDVTYLYMDAIHRFYTTDSSYRSTMNYNTNMNTATITTTTSTVGNASSLSSSGNATTTTTNTTNMMIQPLVTDLNYLFGRTDEPNIVPLFSSPSPKKRKKAKKTNMEFVKPNDTTNDEDDDDNMHHDEQIEVERDDDDDDDAALANAQSEQDEHQHHPLPEGYLGYLGDERSALYRAHTKLARQDPWLLTGEEILALLRALTEDILANHPAISYDMEHREEQMVELLQNKRNADAKFRKVRLAYEGPKKPSRPKSTVATAVSDEMKEQTTIEGQNNEGDDDKNSSNTTAAATTGSKPFVPTATKKQYDIALKAQEKANDAYEKGIRKFVARTEPVGYDRNYSAVYCFLRHPEVLYIEEKKAPSTISFTSSSSIPIPPEMQFSRTSWHIIETTSLCDKYASSLDIRGKREYDLYEVLMGPNGSNGTNQSLYRYLHDDLKELADAKSKVREKAALLERLKMAQIKCDEEKGRRSGRLAGQAEIELIQIQSEIDELENLMNKAKKNDVTTTATTTVDDYRELTGYNLLVQFESSTRSTDIRRATRDKKIQPGGTGATTSLAPKRLPLLYCSKVCQTGNIDGTGIVGMIVSNLLDLEEHCNALSAWDRTDISRSGWINRLENAVTLWSSISPDLYGSTTTTSGIDSSMDASSSRSVSKRDSIGSEVSGSASKRQRTMNSSPAPATGASHTNTLPSVPTIVTILKQALLDLEDRVADITNVALATKDSDLADDNMSVDSDDELNHEQLALEWKRLINKLRSIPARRHTKIRDGLVNAINAARKAHLQQVVTELRAALLLFRPNAPHDSKMAAIQVLISHGDYDASNDDDDDIDKEDEDDNDEDTDDVELVNNNDDATPEEVVPSVLSAEAAILRSSLGGSDDARREDWVRLVKSVKTMSRLASLTKAFLHDAMEKIVKVESERDELINAIQIWSKADDRQSKQRDAGLSKAKAISSNSPREIKRPSEVWADVRYTDEICMAKTDEYPWWPAKVCIAKDPDIAKSLQQLKRSLVAFVGEMGSLRVVKMDCIRPFTGQLILDDDSDTMDEYKKDIRVQLDDCMAMARRIQRGLAKVKK